MKAQGHIHSIEVYERDVVVKRKGVYAHSQNPEPPKRGKVTMLSAKSRRNLLFVAMNTGVKFKTLITLTYPREFPCNGQDVKRHLNRFLTALRRKTKWGLSYLWVLEFQKRGAPHIHIVIDTPLPKKRIPLGIARQWVAVSWYEAVGSLDERHLRAGTRTESIRKQDGARRYMSKYATKMEQKIVPEGFQDSGRFWGHSRDVKPAKRREVLIDERSLRAVFEGYKWYQGDEREFYQVMFGASEHVTEKLAHIDSLTGCADLSGVNARAVV